MKKLATLLMGISIAFLYSCAPTKTGDFTSQKYTNFKKAKNDLVIHQEKKSSKVEELTIAAVEGEKSTYNKSTTPVGTKSAAVKLGKSSQQKRNYATNEKTEIKLDQRIKKTSDKINDRLKHAKLIDKASLAEVKSTNENAGLIAIVLVVLLVVLLLTLLEVNLGFLLYLLWLAFVIVLIVLILRWMGVI